MTAISRLEQKETDFDWFAVDESGNLGHFTTAGFKFLPKSVELSTENLKRITDYFKGLPLTDGFEVDGEIDREAGPFESPEKRAQYLSSFSEMAGRGLYSFDIHTHTRPGLAYFRVAMPCVPLQLESLPDHIKIIVRQTRLSGVLLIQTRCIDYESTLNL